MASRRKPRKVRLLSDVTIPAGTVASVEPAHRRDFYCDYVSVLIAHGNDRTSEWLIPLDDAVSYGLVEAVEKETA